MRSCGVLARTLALALLVAACDHKPWSNPAPGAPGHLHGAGFAARNPSAEANVSRPAPPGGLRLHLEAVAEDLLQPVGLEVAPGDDRLYVVEQGGKVITIAPGGKRATFVDLGPRLSAGGERGLLGLAFPPDYATSRRLFAYYTNRKGDSHLVELRASADGVAADPTSEKLLLFVAQPYPNHNGGQLAFGPDGKLYWALGDGGSGGDPNGNGQRLDTLLGKILRLDVSVPGKATAPADNPFVAEKGARPEIWAYGLRNPWRFSFDRATGDLWIADVGQNVWEEVDFAPSLGRNNAGRGANFGWRPFEGAHCYDNDRRCKSPEPHKLPPIAEYPHPQGCSITGGFVYRGKRIPGLAGAYLFSDYCTGFLRAVQTRGWPQPRGPDRGRPLPLVDLTPSLDGKLGMVSSFGQDTAGELYVVDHRGTIFRLAPR